MGYKYMKEYTAIESFTDLQDNNYRYIAGDAYPRKGLEVSEERFDELATSRNRRHRPMIREIEVKQETPVEGIPEEITEEPKEEPLAVKTGEQSSKTTKTKENGKKK